MAMCVRLLALAGLQLQVAAVPAHMQFHFTEKNLIILKQRQDLRLNVKGGDLEAGDPIVLWNEQDETHEQFLFEDGFIKLKANPGMCLNVEGGISASHNLVTFPCSAKADANPNERFIFTKGRIHPKSDHNLCLNAQGGNTAGSEIVLWQCEGPGHDHELFVLEGSQIRAKSNPELHFNVVGGDVGTPGTKVVLYTAEPSVNELFEIFEGRIHLKQRTEMCLNAEGGLSAGHRIVIWPCSPVPLDNELFRFDRKTGAIHSTKMPELAFNAAGGGMEPGDEVMLWSIKEEL